MLQIGELYKYMSELETTLCVRAFFKAISNTTLMFSMLFNLKCRCKCHMSIQMYLKLKGSFT